MFFPALSAHHCHPYRTELGGKDPLRSELWKHSKSMANDLTKYLLCVPWGLWASSSTTSIRDHFGSCSLGDRSITTYRPSFDGRYLPHFYPLPFLFPCEVQVCFKFHYFVGSNKTSASRCAKETQGTWTMHLQILEEGILRERELFQESLAECHPLTSGKTIQHRSGLPGLASEAILFMKNKKEPDLVYLICPYLKKLLSTRSPLVLRMQIQFLCLRGYPRRQWDKVPEHGPRQTHQPQSWQECCPLALLYHQRVSTRGFSGGTSGKEPACQCRRRKRLGSGRVLGGGHGNPLQHSCLENHMDRGARQATVHRAPKESDTTEAT